MNLPLHALARKKISSEGSTSDSQRRLPLSLTTLKDPGPLSLHHCFQPQETNCPSWISHRPRPHRQVSTGLVRPRPLHPSPSIICPIHCRLPLPKRRLASRCPSRTEATPSTWLPPPYNSSPRWLQRWSRQVCPRVSLHGGRPLRTFPPSNYLHLLPSLRNSCPTPLFRQHNQHRPWSA